MTQWQTQQKNNLLVGGFEKILLIDLQNDQIIHEISTKKQISGCIYHIFGLQDGFSILCAGTDPIIGVWALEDGIFVPKKQYFEHRNGLYALELFENKQLMASAGKDKSIKIWRIYYNDQQFKKGCFNRMLMHHSISNAHQNDITSLKSMQSSLELLLSASTSGEIKLWQINEGQLIKTFKNNSGWVYSILILENYRQPYTIKNGYISPATYKQPGFTAFNQPKPSREKNTYMDFYFVTASFNGSLKLWNAKQDLPINEIYNKNNLECFPYGNVQFLCNDVDETMQVQFITSGQNNDHNLNIWLLKE